MGMQARKYYSRTPITEAVIDIRVELLPEVQPDFLVQVQSSIQAEYPERENMFILEGLMMVGDSVAARANQSQIGYRFVSSDHKQILQTRLDGFTFSRLAPYECWEKFRDEAKRLWSIYESLTNPKTIVRLAVRYINRLDIPLPVGDLKEYLRTFPEVSADLPQGLSGYFMQLQIPQDNLGAILVLNETIVPPPVPDIVSVLLDIDIFKEGNVPNNEVEIWGFLEQLHKLADEVFEACITERTRELIN